MYTFKILSRIQELYKTFLYLDLPIIKYNRFIPIYVMKFFNELTSILKSVKKTFEQYCFN